MAAFMFGVGALTVNSTVVGTLQDLAISVEGSPVELWGSNDFAEDVATGRKKVTVTAKSGSLQGDLIASMLGVTASGTTTKTVDVSPASLGAGAPFAISWTGTYRGKTATFTLPACIPTKFGGALANDKHTVIDLAFQAFKDATTGKVLTIVVAE